MEITKQGILPENWWYEGRCVTCTTEVLFQKKEAKYTAGFNLRACDSYTVTCPMCSGIIYGKFKSKIKPSYVFSYYDR